MKIYNYGQAGETPYFVVGQNKYTLSCIRDALICSPAGTQKSVKQLCVFLKPLLNKSMLGRGGRYSVDDR